jgi:AAA domain
VTFEFHPAERRNVSLLIGIAGASGAGKTYSALELATGLAQGKPFALIDTEAGRALHYADEFSFEHGDLTAPFTPDRYADAIHAADQAGYPVIVVDSFSHEHAGDGGLLDMHEAELQRMAGDDWKKREAVKFAAWIKPKSSHKRMVSQMLQIRAHLILCLRAEEKIEIVKNPQTGKTEVRPKQTLTGRDGWVPICEPKLPFELTVSLMMTPAAPGHPRPIKVPEKLRSFFPLDKPVGRSTGEALAGWAAGASEPGVGEPGPHGTSPRDTDEGRDGLASRSLDVPGSLAPAFTDSALAVDRLRELADELDVREKTDEMIDAKAVSVPVAEFLEWLNLQIRNTETARAKAAA